MKISPKVKRDIIQVMPFGIISVFFGLLYAIVEKGILGPSPTYPSTGNPYHFSPLIIAAFALVFGLIVGGLEVRFFNKYLRHASFIKKISLKIIIYLLWIAGVLLTIIVISNAYGEGIGLRHPSIWENAHNFFSDHAFWCIGIYVAAVIGVCLFYSEVSNHIGQSVLLNYFTGRYHDSLIEDRVFMFLDMKSSTTIAEKLGHSQYFRMLKEYYSDLSQAIIRHGGEIYQYVGDEVVVTWRLDKSDASQKSLDCFFDMKSSLREQSQKYRSRFDVVPSFKAGIHLGTVTTGEIGVIKKDITFSGDVLNTTARIQGLCNSYGVDILISENLKQTIKSESQFTSRFLGEIELRGREEKINLYTLVWMGDKFVSRNHN